MKIKATLALILFMTCSIHLFAQEPGEHEMNTAMDHYHNKQYPEAVEWFTKAANLGNQTAQYDLAICYEDGKGTAESQETANSWYLKAAQGGLAKAQNAVGVAFEKAKGYPQSYFDAAKWYKKAADQGYAMAENNLGVLYNDGLGVPQSYPDALKYYQLAALQNFPKANFNLGVLYFKGLGVGASRSDAISYWEKAAESGYLPAMKILGDYYELMEPNKNGYKKAIKWYLQATDYNDADAAYQVGLLYDNGAGTERNINIAKRAYELAVKLGNEPAKTALAELNAEQEAEVKQVKVKAPHREREKVEVMCMTCFGSGKVHTTIYGGASSFDKYGNRSTVFGEYSSCSACGGKGTVTKFF